jgi:Bacterial SH3 domain
VKARSLTLTLLLAAIPAYPETLYVTEQLVVGVYAQPDLQGERVAQIRSADAVEVLGRDGEAAQIRTADGAEGWVKASYLESAEPLAPRLAALEAENQKLRKAESATTRVDPKPLQKEIADLRAALDAANRHAAEPAAPSPARERPDDEVPVETTKPVRNPVLRLTLLILAVAALGLAAGFAWGYRTLDKRIRAKYGGLKVY